MSQVQNVAKSARLPVAEYLTKRNRVYVGQAYLNSVLGGLQTDVRKMAAHAHQLGLGSPDELKKMKLETLRERLGDKILQTPVEEMPTVIYL